MSFLDKLEKVLEKAIEGTFLDAFPGKVHLLEIAKKMLDVIKQKGFSGVDSNFAPNLFEIYLNSEDFKKLKPLEEKVIPELKKYLSEEANSRGYKFLGEIKIELKEDKDLVKGQYDVEGSFLPLQLKGIEQKGEFSGAFLVATEGFDKGKVFPLFGEEITIGRNHSCDIFIGDPKVSRQHAKIYIKEKDFFIQDLQSRNGTFVNKERVEEQKLFSGDKIVIGISKLEFNYKK